MLYCQFREDPGYGRSDLLRSLLIGSLIATLGASQVGMGKDYADARYVDQWLRHPVYGDPSFDAFERLPGNPIHRGRPPFEWPVNSFLFPDPVSGNFYAYVGDYCEGYGARPSRCLLYRSSDDAQTWTNLGVVLQGDPNLFDKGGHTPDVSVVYDGGRYHMVYDWGEVNFNAEGGLAYAWAERPEGPWHRAPQPITRNTSLPALLGRYQRTYAGTLIRRRHDWLITAMMDYAPTGWALFVMTAPRPEGPWSERRLVRHVERDYYHPPLMEFFPAFAHGGFVYAPATSVALNRNFNVLFRAPIERAADPDAWEIFRHGSLWHSEDSENETYGLWGQTFSGQIDNSGRLWALFNSRDAHGMGTVNLARRRWSQPLRRHGFVLTAHKGPSITFLRQTSRDFRLDVSLEVRGTARIFWNYHGALGPNLPQSDATLHPLVQRSCQVLEISSEGWKILSLDNHGAARTIASSPEVSPSLRHVTLAIEGKGAARLWSEGRELWSGSTGVPVAEHDPGALGIWVEKNSHLRVEQFKLTGKTVPAHIDYFGLEALLGAGEPLKKWRELRSTEFRHGLGLVSKETEPRVKWNVTGRRMILWSPRGPDFGEAEIRVDGRPAERVNLHAETAAPSAPIWMSRRLPGDLHAVVWQALSGALPVDCLEVEE